MKRECLLFFLAAIVFMPAIGQVVPVTVNFDQPQGKIISPYAFSLNVSQGFDATQAGSPGNASYKAGVSDMNPGMIRYHSWNMVGDASTASSWYDNNTNQGWDSVKVRKAMSGAFTFGPQRMMNIPSWPSKWNVSSSDEHLATSHYTDFANWCASLVKIVNVNLKKGVPYWEITNERDGIYNNNMTELGKIYNQAAIAMKAIDPTIKTGGAAFARPDLTVNVDDFFSTSSANIDFASYHTYATGDGNATDASLYDNAAGLGWVTNSFRSEWAKYSSNKIELFHDEFNISWAPPDTKMTNQVGMIFDALAMVAIINAGADGSMAWNECDGWYGKTDNSYNYRPSAYLYKNFNANLRRGDTLCNSSSTNTSKVVTLASRKDSLWHIVLINRADADQYVKINFTGLPSSVVAGTIFNNSENLAAGGIQNSTLTYSQLTASGGFLLKSADVIILTLNTHSNPGSSTVTAQALNNNLCSGQSTTLTASGATTYSWNTGATGSAITVSPTTTTSYTVTGTTGANTASAQIIVNIITPATYSFADVSANSTAINGLHSNIDFGTGNWLADMSFGGLTQCGYFANGTIKSATINLPAGTCLKSIKISSANSVGTYTISDGVNNALTGTEPATPTTLVTNWTKAGTAVTINFTNGWDAAIDDIQYACPNVIIATNVASVSNLTSSFEVYPNPASQLATIAYQLTEISNVKIVVYDLVGKEVMMIANEKQNSGQHQLTLNTSELQNGIYFVKMSLNAEQRTEKLIIANR